MSFYFEKKVVQTICKKSRQYVKIGVYWWRDNNKIRVCFYYCSSNSLLILTVSYLTRLRWLMVVSVMKNWKRCGRRYKS